MTMTTLHHCLLPTQFGSGGGPFGFGIFGAGNSGGGSALAFGKGDAIKGFLKSAGVQQGVIDAIFFPITASSDGEGGGGGGMHGGGGGRVI